MNFSVNKKNCKFYVDKESKKVVCVIPKTEFMAIRFVEANYDLYTFSIHKAAEMLIMPRQFVGIATCHEEDTFDEEMGKLIAYNKARHKLNCSLFKRLNIYASFLDNKLNDFINNCNNYGEKQGKREQARENKIKEHFGE